MNSKHSKFTSKSNKTHEKKKSFFLPELLQCRLRCQTKIKSNTSCTALSTIPETVSLSDYTTRGESRETTTMGNMLEQPE